MRRALVIVAKAPRPGRAKTRLVPPLSPAEAAALSGAFLLDTIETGLSLAWERISLIHPAGQDDAARLSAFVPSAVTLCAQHGAGLGDALRGAFADHFAQGFERVVLIDSDSPTLPARLLDAACAGLADHDVTIGPTADGGYYLLGLRGRHDALFDEIGWSTPSVYRQTLRRAAVLRVQTLPEWYDVDMPDDLTRLQLDLANLPGRVAPHTRQALAGFQQSFRPTRPSFGAQTARRA